MSNYNVADKVSGNPWPATEHNDLKVAVNSKLGYEDVATYADMVTLVQDITEKMLIEVAVDENNNDDASLYLYTGATFRFLFTLPPIDA